MNRVTRMYRYSTVFVNDRAVIWGDFFCEKSKGEDRILALADVGGRLGLATAAAATAAAASCRTSGIATVGTAAAGATAGAGAVEAATGAAARTATWTLRCSVGSGLVDGAVGVLPAAGLHLEQV